MACTDRNKIAIAAPEAVLHLRKQAAIPHFIELSGLSIKAASAHSIRLQHLHSGLECIIMNVASGRGAAW
jgi:predicted dinucleotide-utilizing enzyme